ncbi:MAG: hypothetical protein HKN25_01295 [Pyrinomonadaceae bacterium]|nr:hypothetical protein [Pyrinomonadaceae bacterium]
MEIAAVIFILIMFAVAWVVFRLLKRTVQLLIRAIIVLLILFIAIAGGAALWNMDSLGLAGKNASKKSR